MTLNEFRENIQQKSADTPCPVEKTLTLLSGKWTPRIIYELQKTPCLRFGELRKKIDGITSTMLSATLKELEAEGIVNRTQFNEIPPHVEYSLTTAGWDMLPIFFEMAKWGTKYRSEEG